MQSCSSSSPFTDKELKWFKPFSKIDTSVFITDGGLSDTVIFYGIDTTIFKTRNLEQGFRNEKTLKVTYALTKNSYHKFISLTVKDEPEKFISVTDEDNWTKPSIEICFLGSIYDNTFVDKIGDDTNKIVHFDEASANYKGVNIVEGIKSFEFDFKNGVVSFVDKFDRKWRLKK